MDARHLLAEIVCGFEPLLEFCIHILNGTESDLVVKSLGGGLFRLEDAGTLDRAVGLDREDDVGLAYCNAGERRPRFKWIDVFFGSCSIGPNFSAIATNRS